MKNQTTSIPATTKIIQNPSEIYSLPSDSAESEQNKFKYDGGATDFTECLEYIKNMGKKLFGEHFKIEIEDYEIIYKLVIYFLKREDLAAKYNIHLQKGIMLSGPIGCGKTSLITIMNYFLPLENRFIMKTCRDVSFEFHKDGYEVIQEYSKKANHNRKGELTPKAFCFDDLGVENNLKHFGNECNIMGEILLSRYEMFVHKKAITHITTNLSSSEIETIYGNRVRSRMREMLNLVSFSQGATDKR